MSLLKRYPVAGYFILAYGLSWLFLGLAAWTANGNGILAWVAGFMPAVSAVILSAVTEGRAGLRQLLARLFTWRVSIIWYLVALLSPLALILIALPFHVLFGGQALPDLEPGFWLQTFPSLFLMMLLVYTFGIFMSAGEEIGWRGYAQPRLQAHFGPWLASLILGVLWGIWHLPVFLIPGTTQYGLPFPAYVLASVGYCVIYTCLYNRGKGSVLLASFFHSASNGTILFATAIVPFIVQDMYISLPALAILALIVVAISGYFTRERGLTTEAQRSQRLFKKL